MGCANISVEMESKAPSTVQYLLYKFSDPRSSVRMGDSFRDAAWDNQLDNMLDDLQSSVSTSGETHGYKNGYHNGGNNGHTSREYQVGRETCQPLTVLIMLFEGETEREQPRGP